MAVVGALLALALIGLVLALVELAGDAEQVTEVPATPTPAPTTAAPTPTATPSVTEHADPGAGRGRRPRSRANGPRAAPPGP